MFEASIFKAVRNRTYLATGEASVQTSFPLFYFLIQVNAVAPSPFYSISSFSQSNMLTCSSHAIPLNISLFTGVQKLAPAAFSWP